jgi:hypothetical protein
MARLHRANPCQARRRTTHFSASRARGQCVRGRPELQLARAVGHGRAAGAGSEGRWPSAGGLGAELARRLAVERAQVSRFKAGKETFPSAKLAGLAALLVEP